MRLKLDDFTWFVSQNSYDLTLSSPYQFPIDHDVIHLENFNQSLSGFTRPSPCSLSYDCEVIQLLSSF